MADAKGGAPVAWCWGGFVDGMRTVFPVCFGGLPYAMVVGIVLVQGGFTPGMGVSFDFAVYAGASMLATVNLLKQHTPLAVIVFTALVINLRFLMYSASIGQHLRGAGWGTKAVCAAGLSDQAYAVSIAMFSRPVVTVHKVSFYAGTAIVQYVLWHLSVGCGIVLGAAIPADLSLDFAVPLMFMALLVPMVNTRSEMVAAIASCVVMMLMAWLPYNLGLVVASFCGIAAGSVFEIRSRCA